MGNSHAFKTDVLFREIGEGEWEFIKPKYTDKRTIKAGNPLFPSSNEIFGKGKDLKDNTLYEVEGRDEAERKESFITDCEGNIIWVETQYGYRKGNVELNELRMGCAYVVSPNSKQQKRGDDFTHYFLTHASQGTVVYAGTSFFTKRRISKGERHFDPRNKRRIAPKNSGYDQGHLIACEFGGGMENINLVGMLSVSNRWIREGTLKALLQKLLGALKDAISEFVILRYASSGVSLKQCLESLPNVEHRHGEYIFPNYRFMEKIIGRYLKLQCEVKLCLPNVPTLKTPDGMIATDIVYPRIKVREANGTREYVLRFMIDIDTKNHYECE